jgi:hypothetical protein
MQRIIITRENFLSRQICTTIPPNRKHEINKALIDDGLSVSGTTYGWQLAEDIEQV